MSQSVQQAALPVKAKIWPVVGQQAAHVGRGGAWRAWALAFALDAEGRGAVPTNELESFIEALGVHPRTWRRWLADAQDLGALRFRDWRRGDVYQLASSARMAVLISAEIAALIEQADDPEAAPAPFDITAPRPVALPAADIASDGWRAKVWAAFIASLRGAQISRERMRQITNVPRRSQLRYERAEGVEATPNFEVGAYTVSADGRRSLVLTKATPERIAYEREQGRACFAWIDQHANGPVMARRLPDRRSAPSKYTAAVQPRGRISKIRRQLRRASLNSPAGRAGDCTRRVFHDSVAAADKAAAKMQQVKGNKRAQVPPGWRELMGKRYGTKRRGAGVFAAVPLAPAGI